MQSMRSPACMLIIAALTAGACPAALGADEAEQKRERLRELRSQIETVRDELADQRARRDSAQDELARLEQKIGDIAGEMAKLDERIEATRDRLEGLEARRRELEQRLAAHRDTLAQQLRAAYRMGRQPALRLLLRQDDPSAIARALGYYRYLNEARLAAIDRARELVAQVEEVTRETEQAEQSLADDRAALAQRRQDLEAARGERAALIERLEASIDDKGERLAQLQASRDRLQELVRELESTLGDIPAAPLEEQPFGSRKGALAWPIDGSVRRHFGDARADGRIQWQGIVVAADAGRQVGAVYYGRVVFADWLTGFGQLVIVDHLDGYMSLYGFNRRLLRTVGDWVAPGDPIATVGSSGGQRQSGLYFEIRKDGDPVEPTAWLRR
jgi:septal ring factor EnvC (AmiA/AmiB activator)